MSIIPFYSSKVEVICKASVSPKFIFQACIQAAAAARIPTVTDRHEKWIIYQALSGLQPNPTARLYMRRQPSPAPSFPPHPSPTVQWSCIQARLGPDCHTNSMRDCHFLYLTIFLWGKVRLIHNSWTMQVKSVIYKVKCNNNTWSFTSGSIIMYPQWYPECNVLLTHTPQLGPRPQTRPDTIIDLSCSFS